MSRPRPSTLPLYDLLGIELLHREETRVVLGLPLREDLLNNRGVLHGGVISALLDAALGHAIVTGIKAEEWCATLQLSVQFRRGARHGPFQAEGRMMGRGRSCAFAEGEVHDARDALVACAQGTWHIWPQQPG